MADLFRAKRIDNNQWVYWNQQGRLMLPEYGILASGNVGFALWAGEMLTNRATQSHTIGKLDKNGKEIFGGDIVRHYNDDARPEQYVIGIIEWDAENFRWSNHVLFEDKRYTIGAHCTYEVVGNIVDHEVAEDLQVVPRARPLPDFSDELYECNAPNGCV